MSRVREATLAVKVLSVDAGSLKAFGSCEATTRPLASIITAEVLLLIEASETNSSISF